MRLTASIERHRSNDLGISVLALILLDATHGSTMWGICGTKFQYFQSPSLPRPL